MRRRVASFCIRLMIALGLILGGLGPVWAGAAHVSPAASSMAMMPDMAMPHHSGAKAHHKQMPCCGDDGCCIAGSCALPLALAGSGEITLRSFTDEPVFRHVVRNGVTFAPLLRPPISI